MNTDPKENNLTYDIFIENILNTRGRFNCGETYHEKHHIIPKCLNGDNSEENLIDLYAKEHFIAHRLLIEKYPNNSKLVYAYSMMAFPKTGDQNRYELTPEEYEEARLLVSKARKEDYKDKTKHPAYGKHPSEEARKKMSMAREGNNNCKGRVLSEATRKKIGDANRNPNEERRQRMSQAQKARATTYGNNSKAKKVIRLSDMKVFDCIKRAWEDFGKYTLQTFGILLQNHRLEDYIYYSAYFTIDEDNDIDN